MYKIVEKKLGTGEGEMRRKMFCKKDNNQHRMECENVLKLLSDFGRKNLIVERLIGGASRTYSEVLRFWRVRAGSDIQSSLPPLFP